MKKIIVNTVKKIMHFLTLFFAFSTTKHCDRLDWDEKENDRTLVKRDKDGNIIN